MEKDIPAKSGLFRLIQIAGTKKWWLIASMAFAVCASCAQFIPYVAVYAIISELARTAGAPSTADRALIWRWAYTSLAAVGIYGVLLYTTYMLSHIAAFNILYELRVAISGKLLRLPLGYFSKTASGEIKKILSEDVERIELFVAHHIPDVTGAAVFPVITLAVLFFIDWRLALVILMVFIAAVSLQASMLMRPESKVRMAGYHAALGRMNAGIVEYVRGMQVVKVFNRSIDAFERLVGGILSFRDYSLAVTRDFAFVYTGFLTLLSATPLFIIPAAVLLLSLASSYTAYLPTVFLFLILGGGIFFPLLKLMWMGSLLTQNSVGVGLIDRVLNMPEIAEPAAPETPAGSDMEFRSVSFSYEGTPVLHHISFTAGAGTVTALVGPSGAGKSTIALLAARFWNVGAGAIFLGGVDIRNIPTGELMRRVSFVFQENMLFFDTIEANIRMGRPGASFEEVIDAARAAHCHEFILRLDRGYKTLVGEGGTYLSGGEAQRVALARAILKNAPVVILDEATAYADPENEAKILDSFSRLITGRTVIVIAHRLSTITTADQILVVDGGSIVERGRHAGLLEAGGVYRRMWDAYSRSRNWVLK